MDCGGKRLATSRSQAKTGGATPHSKRYRDCQAQANLAERLECGGFSTAFARAKAFIFCSHSVWTKAPSSLRFAGAAQDIFANGESPQPIQTSAKIAAGRFRGH
jgi:hypothetical protein